MVTFNSARLPRTGSAAPAGLCRLVAPTSAPPFPALAYRHSSQAPRTPRLCRACPDVVIRTIACVLGALTLVGAPGCESSSKPHSLSEGSRKTAAASPEVPASRAWRDVDAAVSAACTVAEVAVLRVETPAPGVRRYELLSITDGEGLLTATAPPGCIDGDSPIARLVPVAQTLLECEISGADATGRDEGREAVFLRAIRDWRPRHPR